MILDSLSFRNKFNSSQIKLLKIRWKSFYLEGMQGGIMFQAAVDIYTFPNSGMHLKTVLPEKIQRNVQNFLGKHKDKKSTESKLLYKISRSAPPEKK